MVARQLLSKAAALTHPPQQQQQAPQMPQQPQLLLQQAQQEVQWLGVVVEPPGQVQGVLLQHSSSYHVSRCPMQRCRALCTLPQPAAALTQGVATARQ